MQDPCYKIDDRVVRHCYKQLEKKLNRKTSHEKKATGIARPWRKWIMYIKVSMILLKICDFNFKRTEEKHKKELKTNKEIEIAEKFQNA